MDYGEYVAARYGRLIERAMAFGCPEGEAVRYVDQVLASQRRQIRRAEDPDPVVVDALERLVRGEPERHRCLARVVMIGLITAVAVIALVVTYQPTPQAVTMPSVFGYDQAGATLLLERAGFRVRVHTTDACEPPGQVIGSVPPPGAKVATGATVEVDAAAPADEACFTDYDGLLDAWKFIRFAIGGGAPKFSATIEVVDGDGISPPLRLTRGQAAGQAAWGRLLEIVRTTASQQASTLSGMALLDVSSGVPPSRWCGRLRPAYFHHRGALRLVISTHEDGDGAGCPLTVDLYRRHRAIDGVVVYPAREG